MVPSSTKAHVGNVDEDESITKGKEKAMGKKIPYADIVICEKSQRSIMLEMARHGVSTNVAVTTDMK